MPTTKDYIDQLKIDKQNLVDNLKAQGVEVSDNATFTDLAPKVYDIINNQEKTANPSTSSQTITADSGYSGLSSVTINPVTSSIDSDIQASNIKNGVNILGVTGNVVELNGETKTVNPATTQQIITPSQNKNAITEITINAVTNSIDSNITANNIKKDVTILGVTGTLDFNGAYVVPTTAARDSLSASEGDICLVYSDNIAPISSTMTFDDLTVTFPDTVVFDTIASNHMYLSLSCYSTTGPFYISVQGDTSACTVTVWKQGTTETISYTSSDGLTYTKTSGISTYTFPSGTWNWDRDTDEDSTHFILTGSKSFTGLYKYSNNTWSYLDIGIDTVASEVLKDKTAYTSNGLITGTLESGSTPEYLPIDENFNGGTVYFPEEVVFDTAISTSLYNSFQYTSPVHGGPLGIDTVLSSSGCSVYIHGSDPIDPEVDIDLEVAYSTSDGLTYTRTSQLATYDFPEDNWECWDYDEGAEKFILLEATVELTDEAVIEYLVDKPSIVNDLPQSYGNGDLEVYKESSNYALNMSIGNGYSNINSQLMVSLQNLTNKTYVLKYDDNGTNLAYAYVGPLEFPNAQFNLDGISADVNNISAIDVSNNTTDKYKITFPLDSSTTSVVFAEVLHIDQNYGLLTYINDCDTLIDNGFYDGANLNLFRVDDSASEPTGLMNSWITAGETFKVDTKTVSLANVGDDLGVYFTIDYDPKIPVETVNDIEVYKYSAQTQDYTIPVEISHKTLDNITVTSYDNMISSSGVYINTNTKYAMLEIVRPMEYPYYTVDVTLTYSIDGTTVDTFETQMPLDMEKTYLQLPQEFADNIDPDEADYTFNLVVEEHTDL